MKLQRLIDAASPLRVTPVTPGGRKDPEHTEISGICYRSDRAVPGSLFVAIKGARSDGHAYTADAVRRGAAAVVVEHPVDVNATMIEVADSRAAMAAMACEFYGRPSERMTLVGITGTNGKTTTSCLLEHILTESGIHAGVIGTIDCHFGTTVIPGALTTPESVDLQERLARMAEAGVTHVVMEVSSHGVVQQRIAGCRFAAGVFTNLSQDHLDFHGNMDAYRAAKTAFFTDCLADDAAVLVNCDTGEGKRLADGLAGREIITLGVSETEAGRRRDVSATETVLDQTGITGRLVLPSGVFDFQSPLVGRFNLENILCAAGAAHVLGVDGSTIAEALAGFFSVPGRLEKIANGSQRHVFVDYSHTPDALENVLLTLRATVPGRLICIFGCGGDRDRGKRPKMGEAAARLADLVIVTSDNPRTEDPERIIADILAGMNDNFRDNDRGFRRVRVEPEALDSGFEPGSYTVIPDRAVAIDAGIRISEPGDGVLIAGKGHETYQIIGEKTIDFDDRVHAKKALALHWEK